MGFDFFVLWTATNVDAASNYEKLFNAAPALFKHYENTSGHVSCCCGILLHPNLWNFGVKYLHLFCPPMPLGLLSRCGDVLYCNPPHRYYVTFCAVSWQERTGGSPK